MKSQPLWPTCLMVLGIPLMLLGPLMVGWLVPATAVWSEEEALALTKAGADLHAAMHAEGASGKHSHGHGAPSEHEPASQPLATAEATYQAQHGRLESSRARRNWLLLGTRGLGVVLALAGVIGFAIHSQAK